MSVEVGQVHGGFEVRELGDDTVLVGVPGGRDIAVPRERFEAFVEVAAARTAKAAGRGTFAPVAVSLTEPEWVAE